jgi:hypothetical protein
MVQRVKGSVKGSEKGTRRRVVNIEGWELRAFVNVPTMAAVLDLGKTRAWELVYAGVLPSVKQGASRKVVVAGLKAYIARVCEEAGCDADDRGAA